jgi:putative CocE/NonD family hydrolase
MPSRMIPLIALAAWLVAGSAADQVFAQEHFDNLPAIAHVDMRWGIKIPMRDGVHLDATLYIANDRQLSTPCIFNLTPYDPQDSYGTGIDLASHTMTFLAVSTRGRGDSGGHFRPFLQEANDGYDVVEWLARQPYCNGKIAMTGYSYGGYVQWATAKLLPAHLATIIPTAPAYPGRDFPMRSNIFDTWAVQWLIYTGGHTLKDNLLKDDAFWDSHFREWYRSGHSFSSLDTLLGGPSPIYQEWLSHPAFDDYWSQYTPTASQYAKLNIPILTITGIYDGDQVGALLYYRQFMHNASGNMRSHMYLIIGPWDHAGTSAPTAEVGGVHFGPNSMIEMPALRRQWFAWTMLGGEKPQFLQSHVAYYVTGAEKWKYADTLESITRDVVAYYLDSKVNSDDVYAAGLLSPRRPHASRSDHYLYDPRNIRDAERDTSYNANYLIDQAAVLASRGHALVYHTAPFAQDTEISGFFNLSVWLGIDTPDTDFRVSIYEIDPDGRSILLTTDQKRARYRRSLTEQKLVTTTLPERYDFSDFTFVSRLIRKGERLRLVIGPANSITSQRNYGKGGTVSDESVDDARTVTVMLFHDVKHPSVLNLPIGRP